MTTTQKRMQHDQAVDLHRFEGADVWQESDDHARIRGYFPITPGTPNASGVDAEDLTIVSIEIEPENHLPTHRDSNEELLVVTQGTVEATVGEGTIPLSSGQCAIVPEMEPHGIRNTGEETARIVGVFPTTELTATFEETLQPFGTDVVTLGGDSGIGDDAAEVGGSDDGDDRSSDGI